MKSETSDANPILIVTIDIGENVKDNITIAEGQSLEEVAISFCEKHKLNPTVQSSIEAYLKESLSTLPYSEATEEMPQRHKSSNAGVRLYTSGLNRIQQRQQKLQELKEQKAQEEVQNLTFKPKINKAPVSVPVLKSPIFTSKDKVSSKFKECTFAPNINEHSRKLATLRRENSNDALRRHRSSSKDPENMSFTPRTGRSPQAERPKNIFEHLYSNNSKSISRNTFRPTSSKFVANHTSSKIMDKIKVNRFIEIFHMLNPQNGLISFENIQKDKLSPELWNILNPLLEELKETQETLLIEEFCGALDALLKVLTPEERFKVVFSHKKKPESFVVKTEKKMKHPPNVYNRMMEYKNKSETKLQKHRKERQEREMQGCTFKPNFNNK